MVRFSFSSFFCRNSISSLSASFHASYQVNTIYVTLFHSTHISLIKNIIFLYPGCDMAFFAYLSTENGSDFSFCFFRVVKLHVVLDKLHLYLQSLYRDILYLGWTHVAKLLRILPCVDDDFYLKWREKYSFLQSIW